MRIGKLTSHRRLAWHSASLTFGLLLIWFGHEKGLFSNPSTRTFEVCVFVVVWLLVVGLFRVWARDAKNLEP